MTRKLDFSVTWAGTRALLDAHKEGLTAFAGLLLFLPDWAGRLFAGEPDMEGVSTPAAMLGAIQDYYASNWAILLPTGLVSFFGAVAIYVLLVRRDVPTNGAALGRALALLPFYFVVQLVGGLITFAAMLLLIVPALYVSGRFSVLGAVAIGESERGLTGSISRAWDLTSGNGWAAFGLVLIVALVSGLIAAVTGLMVGLFCRLIVGPEGIPFVETGIDAAFGAAISTIMLALSVSIYRQLSAQDA